MNTYVTRAVIKALREQKNCTQQQLADQLHLSAKTISKWETGKGLPDISLLEPLAAALGVSVIELMQGAPVANRNRSGNMRRVKFYVCPVCGNVQLATGESVISCCGILLPTLEPEPDTTGICRVQKDGDEYTVTVDHPHGQRALHLLDGLPNCGPGRTGEAVSGTGRHCPLLSPGAGQDLHLLQPGWPDRSADWAINIMNTRKKQPSP